MPARGIFPLQGNQASINAVRTLFLFSIVSFLVNHFPFISPVPYYPAGKQLEIHLLLGFSGSAFLPLQTPNFLLYSVIL